MTRQILVDEEIVGDLARVAIDNGWAECIHAESVDQDGDGLDDLTVAQLKVKAAETKVDLGDASKKADIIAVLRAVQTAAE
ncbi:hypothetical protein [Rhizobium halophytocola]|uniref:Rho termination factor N-terminal domain-containing protein n=1 Tax=Rhizobium halophytocola TaxID=735519 RepID=A0ABS4DVG3_9HYPH|nr:hypothetical protein [Rhizobium halophytocola]MBP1849689.1 hypothetical protein [Rhizobium halophytocola]